MTGEQLYELFRKTSFRDGDIAISRWHEAHEKTRAQWEAFGKALAHCHDTCPKLSSQPAPARSQPVSVHARTRSEPLPEPITVVSNTKWP